MILQERFRLRLQEALALRGMKQAQLAGALGWTPQRLSDFVRGHRKPGFKTVELVAKALHIDPADLISAHEIETVPEIPSAELESVA